MKKQIQISSTPLVGINAGSANEIWLVKLKNVNSVPDLEMRMHGGSHLCPLAYKYKM